MPDLPHCFHLGTQRAGSTYLYNLLAQCPEVGLTNVKEISFYTANFHKGFNWYLNSFNGGEQKIDTSVKYFMRGATAAPRIKTFVNGHAPKFLLILRNPIDYVHSHYQVQRRTGYFKGTPKDTVEFIRLNPWYAERGKYWRLLKGHWLSRFDLSNFELVCFEQFIDNTPRVMGAICQFFCLKTRDFSTVETSKHHLLNNGWLYNGSKALGVFPRLKQALKRSPAVNLLYKWFLASGPPTLTKEDRSKLAEYFATDVKQLAEHTDFDVWKWEDFI